MPSGLSIARARRSRSCRVGHVLDDVPHRDQVEAARLEAGHAVGHAVEGADVDRVVAEVRAGVGGDRRGQLDAVDVVSLLLHDAQEEARRAADVENLERGPAW